ncbi:alcohol dehydrogenase [Fusarium mexicanum]|uniref:Alcohol dehydrogenase n=1 Tax=Fusarium mexicanum TaxID=751941 RepID=A0A8H5IVD2_9HYPO|nr:alcohol dehydrogenase [Fusarium mexicanum]
MNFMPDNQSNRINKSNLEATQILIITSAKNSASVTPWQEWPLVSRMGAGTVGSSRLTYAAIPSQDELFSFLDHSHEAGVTFWDSAELSVHTQNRDTYRGNHARSERALTSVTLRRAVKIIPAAAIQIDYSAVGLYCEGE